MPLTVGVGRGRMEAGNGGRRMHSSSCIQDRNRPSKAVRLIFAFDGNKVELQSQQTVEMVLPPSHPVPHNDGEAGFWYELRDQADHLLYRRVLHDPMRDDVEVFGLEAERL